MVNRCALLCIIIGMIMISSFTSVLSASNNCGDGFCDVKAGEDIKTCPSDCVIKPVQERANLSIVTKSPTDVKIVYTKKDVNITVSLYSMNGKTPSTMQTNLFINITTSNKLKYGAIDNSKGKDVLSSYRYILSSTMPTYEKDGWYYYFNEQTKEFIHTDFRDICNKQYEPYNKTIKSGLVLTLYNKSANCVYTLYSDKGINYIQVDFISDKNIDPLFATGSGTSVDPFHITNWTELNSTRLNMTAYYVLDVNLSSSTPGYAGIGNDWAPIGNTTTAWRFSGNFNGQGNTISDLIINKTSISYVGLFGWVTGTISNIGLLNESIIGAGTNAGGLVGLLVGTINNSYTEGRITAGLLQGGLVGNTNTGKILNSHSSMNIVCNQASGNSGGLGGVGAGIINNSYATGNITVSGTTCDVLGGLIAQQTGNTVFNSYSTSNINSSNATIVYGVGGFAGTLSQGSVTNSYSTGNIYSPNSIYATGGFAGTNFMSIFNCYSTSNITGGNATGGLVGKNWLVINNSYSTGTVNGTSMVGGLIGWNDGATYDNAFRILNSYSTGKVVGLTQVGGLIGFYTQSTNGINNNTFWDIDTSGQATSNGTEIGKTTSEMKTLSTFTGWNITTILLDLNNGYPFLSWQIGNTSSIWTIYSATPYQQSLTSPFIIVEAPAYVTMNIPFTIRAHTYNTSGQLVNCTNGGGAERPKLYVRDNSDGTMLINNMPMTEYGVGMYLYNLSVPKQSIYYAYATCVIDHVPYNSNTKAITSMNIPVDSSLYPKFRLNECRHLKLGLYNKHLVFDKQMGCFDPEEVNK